MAKQNIELEGNDVKDDIIKEDDKDLDTFDNNEEEEDDKEETKEENKINWKKILPYVAVAIIFYMLGKRNERFVPISTLKYKIPDSKYWNEDQIEAVAHYINAYEKAVNDGKIVLCKDKKYNKKDFYSMNTIRM